MQQDDQDKEVTLAAIIESDRIANREELEELYRLHCCAEVTDYALAMFRTGELRRFVAIGYYDTHKKSYTHNRMLVMLITQAVGVSETSVYDWVQIKRRG